MIIKVLGAFLAIYAFAIVLETPKKYLWCAGVVSAVGWFVYWYWIDFIGSIAENS